MDHLFFVRFFISSMFLSFLIVAILIIKKVFCNHISIKWQYHICFLYFFILIIPFIPIYFYSFSYESILNIFFNNPNTITEITNQNILGNTFIQNTDWLQDFSVSVNHNGLGNLNIILMSIWFLGATISGFTTLLCSRKIKLIKDSILPFNNKDMIQLFQSCKTHAKINKSLVLGQSPLVQSPIIFGFFTTYVVLPIGITKNISYDDLRYILLHELSHYKNKDILINYTVCLLQILYWFHPLVWIVFKQLRTDREIACDVSVLNMIGENQYINYGLTIINFADKISQSSPIKLAANMGGTKKQIKKRIEKIASFQSESRILRIKSVLIFLLAACIVVSQAPTVSATMPNDKIANFNNSNVIYEDLSPYFEDYNGAFVLYNSKLDQYHIYNKEMSSTRISPNSTYKIYSALIALETNQIQKDNTILKWDGTNNAFPQWNKDQDIYSAMKNSTNWYFQKLDSMVGYETLQDFYKKIKYGNANISGGISNYWWESTLVISPVEQVQLLNQFYNNKNGFKNTNIEVVKNAIKLSEKEGAVLSGKTGTGTINNIKNNGWFIGYVETGDNVFYFATNIQDKNSADGVTAAKITLSILDNKGIY